MLPDIQPGNTKILYFFNCLLDGMHTKIILICDFSRGGLNTPKPCSEATNKDYFIHRGLCFGSCLWIQKQNQNLKKGLTYFPKS